MRQSSGPEYVFPAAWRTCQSRSCSRSRSASSTSSPEKAAGAMTARRRICGMSPSACRDGRSSRFGPIAPSAATAGLATQRVLVAGGDRHQRRDALVGHGFPTGKGGGFDDACLGVGEQRRDIEAGNAHRELADGAPHRRVGIGDRAREVGRGRAVHPRKARVAAARTAGSWSTRLARATVSSPRWPASAAAKRRFAAGVVPSSRRSVMPSQWQARAVRISRPLHLVVGALARKARDR